MEKDIQKHEALERMKMLKLHPTVLKEFEKEDKIKEWENETGNLVYHAVFNNFEFGRCLSLFYVSQYQEEWEMDRKDLNEDYPFVYVMNIDDPCCSEYGTIGIRKAVGGILRIA